MTAQEGTSDNNKIQSDKVSDSIIIPGDPASSITLSDDNRCDKKIEESK